MNTDFEVAIVGGSLSGAALGLTLAKRGIRVLILERDSMFRDRVRGEGMHPWGAAEAQALSILELLTDGCGQELPYWTRHAPASCTGNLIRVDDVMVIFPRFGGRG
jgi:2-polyprenyl-6-methoxyphenol hydroxylase-like FAD-dependent oxidoreductase